MLLRSTSRKGTVTDTTPLDRPTPQRRTSRPIHAPGGSFMINGGGVRAALQKETPR